MIDPNAISTIRVDQLAEANFNLTDNLPHEVGQVLKRGTVQKLVDLIASVINASGGVGYLPLSVTDGQQLPNVPTDASFFLCGKGNFLNVNGFPNIVCTEELNAIMSLSDHWEIAVQIPIDVNPESIGIAQTITEGVVDSAPSQDAVYNALNRFLNSVGTFHYADLATQTTPINVTANTETLLTNDALGEYTSITNAPYGVPTVYNATNNEFDFSALAVGDLVHIRPDLLIDLVGTNTSYEIYMKFAIGTASEWVLNLSTSERKSTDEFKKNAYLGFDIANEDTRTAPAKMFIKTDAAATVKVNGYYLEVLRKNINIVDFTDSNAVHKTGNETIQGVKTFEDKIVGKAGELHGIVIASENEELAGIGSNDDFKPFFFLKKLQSIAKGIIKNELLTGVRTYEMPDASGTLALTEIIVNKISGTKTLSNADNGKVFILTANCTVTIPSGLTSGFNATFRTLTGATYSQSLGGGVTLLGNVGSTMGEKSSFTMVNTDVANEYLITGSL